MTTARLYVKSISMPKKIKNENLEEMLAISTLEQQTPMPKRKAQGTAPSIMQENIPTSTPTRRKVATVAEDANSQKIEVHQDGQVDEVDSPDIQENKSNAFKDTLSKFIPIFGPVKGNCSKNEAIYLEKKRKKKIRNAIIFAVFSAIIATIITVSIILGYPLMYVAGSIIEGSDPIAHHPGFYRINPDLYLNWFFVQASYIRHIFVGGGGLSDVPAVWGAIIIVSLGYIVITIAHAIVKIFAKGDNKRRKTIITLIASLIKYVGYLVILIFLFEIFDVNPAILAAIIAALGLAVGFGAQGVLSDLLTGLFLIFESNLQVGDIITVDGFRGEVEEIGMRTTRFTSVTGDVKVINNSEFKKFVNMSMHRSVAICDFVIEYGENIERVEELVKGKIADIAENYDVITEGPYYKGVVEFNEKGVMLRVVAKCDETERLQLNRDLNREFKVLFDDNGIRLAVPKVQLCDSALLPGAKVNETGKKKK